MTKTSAGLIEPTEEMLEAGVSVIRALEYQLWEERTPEQLRDFVLAIFRAVLTQQA